jgi:hypothetical protein
LNQQKFKSCLEFTADESDKDSEYQTANVELQDVTDEDTLDFSLNAKFSGGVGGTIEGIQANAEATTAINTSYHLNTYDEVFVAHASVTSGVDFVGPKGPNAEVKLTLEMADLASKDPERFRQTCGEGFVRSIAYGADLYILLNFHKLDEKTRVQLDYSSKASAGMGDVFKANGSSELTGC